MSDITLTVVAGTSVTLTVSEGGGVSDHAGLPDLATSGHPASIIANTPAGSVAATTVQAAINELDSEKAAKASNLSDLASASTARTNLGLGGAATLSVGTSAGTVAAGDDSRITGALSAATAASTYQPLDADLTALAAMTAPATTLAGAAQKAALSIPGNGDGQYVSTPDHADLDATTQLEISVRCAMADWTPSAIQALAAKWESQNSWVLSVNTTGVLRLTLNTGAGVAYIESSTATGFTDGTWHWVKVTWRSSDGRVQFFTSADGATPSYSQLGTNVTLASGETIVNSTAPVELGGIALRTAYYATRVDYARAIVCTTIDGSAVADYRADIPATRYLDSTGKLWTVTGSATGWCLPFLTGPLETFTVSGLAAELITPPHPNGHLVIYHLGSSETEASWRTSSDKATIRAALSAAGYMVASVDAEYNWGNQTAVNAYAALIAAVRVLSPVDKVLHVAQSMGGLASLVGISQGAFQADGWAGIFPACSLAQPYAGSFTAVIKTAYGIAVDGSDYASKTAGHDPVLMSGSLFTLPMRFYASTADTVIPKASHTDVMAALVAATTPESTVVACSGDHGDPSHFQPTDLVDFLGRCVA